MRWTEFTSGHAHLQSPAAKLVRVSKVRGLSYVKWTKFDDFNCASFASAAVVFLASRQNISQVRIYQATHNISTMK